MKWSKGKKLIKKQKTDSVTLTGFMCSRKGDREKKIKLLREKLYNITWKDKKMAAKRKINPALLKPLTPSANLAAVVGSASLPRCQAIKKTWAYIKKAGLQDKKNRRNINADAKMAPLFGKKKQVSMFELASIISKNLK